MWRDLLTETHRGEIGGRGTDNIDDIEAEGLIDVPRQTHIAEIFDEESALDVVGVELADAVIAFERERGEVGDLRGKSRNADFLRDCLRDEAVIGRVNRGDAGVRNIDSGPIEAAPGPEDRAHCRLSAGRYGECF